MSKPTRSNVNQRQSRRCPPWGKVKATCQRGTTEQGPNLAVAVLDVSETGVRLLVQEAMQPGRMVSLALDGPSNARPLTRRGTVIWSVPAVNGAHCVGISLHQLFDYNDLMSLT